MKEYERSSIQAAILDTNSYAVFYAKSSSGKLLFFSFDLTVDPMISISSRPYTNTTRPTSYLCMAVLLHIL